MIILGTGGYSVYQRLDAERQRVQDLADARAERIARMAREAEEAKRKAEALQRADDEAWKNATTQPVIIPKLKDYLVKFPKGRHVAEAAQRLTSLAAFLSRCDELASPPGEAKQGPGVPFNNIQAQQAIGACRKAVAADPQDARLQSRFGRALSAGKEFSEAKVWLEKAAAKGFDNSMSNLGWLYFHGNGVRRDYTQARAWFEKAAAKGHAAAMFALGVLYHTGRDVPRDYAMARSWYEKAAAKGYAHAKEALKALDRKRK
jgi:TPR repeat protein